MNIRIVPAVAVALLATLSACNGSGSSSSASSASNGGNDTGTPPPPTTPPPPAVPDAPACVPGNPPIELTGSATSSQAKTYQVLPFNVAPGTTRVEVSYQWTDKGSLGGTPITQTVFDLGLWDNHGYRSAAGFRGWSGSRQGRIDQKQSPVFVQSDSAERGYYARPIEPGTWYVELGTAAVEPEGADWLVRVQCLNPVTGATPAADPVDPAHVARAAPGWYYGDFHMHGYHSNSHAPTWDGVVQQARDAKLDFLMAIEYVTGAHWNTMGPVQRANPDLLIWPGREIITYYGHVMTDGETPTLIEYRHGFEDITLGEIQREARQIPGVLFQVNHPTTFPGPVFANFCRGCEFQLGDQIDWNQVDSIEVQNGPNQVNSTDLGLPDLTLETQNPFTLTAIILWDDLLKKGYKITGVSGSDSKGVDDPADRARTGYGSSATAVYARELSRDGLREAIKAGHAYVKVFGVDRSPSLEMKATTADGQTGMFGDTLHADNANLEVTVTGGNGQLLYYLVNGLPFLLVPITSDPFTVTLPIERLPLEEGPLGTFWRVQTFDLTRQAFTTIGNPVFLKPAGSP